MIRVLEHVTRNKLETFTGPFPKTRTKAVHSLIDHAVSQAVVTVSPELVRICPFTTRTTTSRTTIIAPACPTRTITSPGLIKCPLVHCDIACPLDESTEIVTVGCPSRCCPLPTPTVTVRPTCRPCGCPGPITAYSVQNCPLDA
ncbi:hypothetical protein MMC22_006325 [Lobaria immixta]|nr:hypothetical protein [Lobaria immixta]